MRSGFVQHVGFSIPAVCIILAAFFMIHPAARANALDDLKKSIDQKNEEIKQLEEDAKKYRTELSNKQQMGKSLKQELTRIRTNIKKLQNDIGITQQQIKRAELQIGALSYEISDKEQSIAKLQSGLAGLLAVFYETERNSNIETCKYFFWIYFKLIDKTLYKSVCWNIN